MDMSDSERLSAEAEREAADAIHIRHFLTNSPLPSSISCGRLVDNFLNVIVLELEFGLELELELRCDGPSSPIHSF